jgi:ABC-2 type transport system permease protein
MDGHCVRRNVDERKEAESMSWPRIIHWKAEWLRFNKQPLARLALGALLLVLLVASTAAGLQARAWRVAAASDEIAFDSKLQASLQQFQGRPLGPANATATYQLGRGELGLTRMPVSAALGLGVQRLDTLPSRLKASLESRHVQTRDPSPLHNPLLSDAGLPGLPSMAALLISLVALVLCSGLLQEEREQGRLGLLRVQSKFGIAPVLAAALGWRLLALWAVGVVSTMPALLLDPGVTVTALAQWASAMGAFSAIWVIIGGLLSFAPMSGATSMLAALGIWVTLTFAAPAGLSMTAQQQTPTPSRLTSIVALRAAQHDSEDNEQELAEAWYLEHPHIKPQLPATWPASFVTRVLDKDLVLESGAKELSRARLQQADFVNNWSWISPALALVLFGERLAGTDVHSHVRYMGQVNAFEQRWREFFVPHVMNRQGLPADKLTQVPRFSALQVSP